MVIPATDSQFIQQQRLISDSTAEIDGQSLRADMLNDALSEKKH